MSSGEVPPRAESNELARNQPNDQGCRVSEVQESARRWSGYVCPDCRFVFRVPRDHDGRGLVCPSCGRLLKIPGKDDVVPSLMVTPQKAKSTQPADPHAHARAHYEHAKPEWERSDAAEVAPVPHFRQKHTLLWVLGGLSVAAMGLVWLLRPTGHSPTVTKPVPAVPERSAEKSSSTELEGIPDVPLDYQAFRREAEATAKRFLEAKTVAEMAKETPNPAQTEARAKSLFPDGKIEAPGFVEFKQEEGLINQDRFSTAQVQTRWKGALPLTFVRTKEGWKIDWESWSGWSEVSWADALAQRSTKLVRLRATVAPIQYYNFYFNDESRWRSFKLESSDGEHLLYGYVERGSEVETQLSRGLEITPRLLIEVRFPGDPSARNQVFLTRLVNTGWTDFDESTATP